MAAVSSNRSSVSTEKGACVSTVAATENPPEAQANAGGAGEVRWNPLTRIVFRFCFVYFGLFCLAIPQIPLQYVGWFETWLPPRAGLWEMQQLEPALGWVGRTVFGVNPRVNGGGSGDQAIFWVLLFCVLVIAVLATAAWTLLDRRRSDYRPLAGWFLLFVRLCLGGQMFTYGFAKLIPTQMTQPLWTLVEPYGNFSLMSVLWNQVGASQPYEMLLGVAEVLAGVMLFIPRTALVGAMLALVDLAQVFVLNMTFDVPVKLLSSHLLLLSLLLLAPEARRLVTVLVLGRDGGPSTAPYPFRTPRSRRIGALAQVVAGLWLLVGNVHTHLWEWHEIGSARAKPPLYGVWTVSQFTRDGQELPPLLTDQTRWRRVVFDYPGLLTYQRMDDTLVNVLDTVDPRAHRMVLTTATPPPKPVGALTFQQPAPDKAVLTGELDGHRVTMSLERDDIDRLPLRSTGFHWVQEVPHR